MADVAWEKKSTVFKNGERTERTDALIVEEPLSIRIGGQPYAVVMRTPGNELNHAAGFCLAEGLIDSPGDIVTLGFCTEDDTNVVTVTLTPEREAAVAGLLSRKGFVSQTSCGICGKEVIRDMQQVIAPAADRTALKAKDVVACLDILESRQNLYVRTRGAHAAMILDENRGVMAVAEDVGRHNALDKAVGKVFRAGTLGSARAAMMSSRLSYELVQKAGRAGLELLVGMSSPTALAVQLAESVNITLACIRSSELTVFCGEQRILGFVTK
ncbi:MAG: formate dehydrogenase accessory sulfurtransferase FdhD [Thermodesulfobacteriota bacterium]|nr:formate dehydrogenase accessory sulfurtransferase FdhD [Thermodesulfobacteriota bacterium]